MRIRRCTALLLEPREQLSFDLGSLLRGGNGLSCRNEWIALAAHLDAEVPVSDAERDVLGQVGETAWVEAGDLGLPMDAVASLLAKGLLLSDAAEHADIRRRDDTVRAQHWKPLSAVAHAHSRWSGIDAVDAARETLGSTGEMVDKLGAPPPAFRARCEPGQAVALAPPEHTPLDALLATRVTCRNFDAGKPVDARRFSQILHRVFGAQAQWELAPGAVAVKKTSPSGGGLHATEAYLLLQHVEGVAPGLYHYHPGTHALEPLDLAAPETLAARAQAFVAGQHWFADAPVQVVLAPRFRRSFWKYRNHAKAYRALILDAGHLSQTLYLTATELGLGAFITAAINEVAIEQAFGLDPLEEGPLAVCGFGWRADTRETVEFDPMNAVWKDAAPST
jgi:putative peptide maturation dehydrogenase